MTEAISQDAQRRLEQIKACYPQSRSAIMPALYLVQEELGVVDQRGVNWVAKELGIAPVHVWEVATFYTMFRKKRCGKYHLQLCRTLSCQLNGAKELKDLIKEKLGCLQPGQVSEDGMWSYEEVECLGSCGTGPVCQINDHYFERLDAIKLDALIDRIKKEKPDLSLSTLEDCLGEGFGDIPKSAMLPVEGKGE